MKPTPPIELTIEKLVFGGQGFCHREGKNYFAWNALPGETVKARILKKRRAVYETLAEEILNPSADRRTPLEDHYLSCSPWQILSFEAENEWKKKIALETYARLAKIKNLNDLEIVSDPNATGGYRNKMEYSFKNTADGLSLAFFQRDTHWKRAISPCRLAHPAINRAGVAILTWLRQEKFQENILKSLVIRCNQNGRTLAGLFIHEDLKIPKGPALDENLAGFQIYSSNPETPAAVPQKLLYSRGENHLEETIKNTRLRLGLFSFFQINPPLFDRVLEDVAAHLDPSQKLVDFYAGVGAIGLSLHGKYKECVLIEENQEAIGYADRNIGLNGYKNCQAKFSKSEELLGAIDKESVLIFDPPRAGLHPKIVEKILTENPPKIIYLSCNLSTHARDLELLSSRYQIRELKLYNFFPRTPHIEALSVLDLNLP